MAMAVLNGATVVRSFGFGDKRFYRFLQISTGQDSQDSYQD